MTGVAASTLPRSLLLPVSRRWSEIAAAVYGVAVVGLVAASSAGFCPRRGAGRRSSTLWLAVIALLLRERIRIRLLELVYVGGMLAFTAWVALSDLWTPSVTSTMHEVQRDIAYTGGVAAGVVLVRSRAVPQLLGGVLVGDRARQPRTGSGRDWFPTGSAGSTRRSFDYRLSAPITYWNGLGIFATIGLLLALGFAARGRRLLIRALAASHAAAAGGHDLLHLQPRGVVRACPRSDRRDRDRPAPAAADRDRAGSGTVDAARDRRDAA